jgi:hypothetical protein
MAISDYLTNIYSRFTTFSRTTTFRFIAAVTVSSLLTSISLLSFQSFQRKTQRRALRDSVEGRLAIKEEERQRRNGNLQVDRPSISRRTTIDDKDEELIDYSDTTKAQQQRRDRQGYSTPLDTIDLNGTKIYDEEIIKEQLARNIAFLGEEAVDKIRNSFVIVVGIGGVGSAAGKLDLIRCIDIRIYLC